MRNTEDKPDSKSKWVKMHVLNTVDICAGLKTKRDSRVSVIGILESVATVFVYKILYRLIMDKQNKSSQPHNTNGCDWFDNPYDELWCNRNKIYILRDS